jgi:hypothetical protein
MKSDTIFPVLNDRTRKAFIPCMLNMPVDQQLMD